MEDEVMIIEEAQDAGLVVFSQEKAMIDMQISTAKAFPRNLKRATENALAIVTMDKETAATCNYAVPRGGKQITGPSVHLARIIVQTWGNMRAEAKIVAVDKTHVTSEAMCFDLETNVAVKTQVKRSIVGKHGRFNEDMITVTGNAANAIAYRNAVFSVIPKAVVDKVYKAAIQTITGDISDKNKLIAKRKQVVDGIKDAFNVTEAEIIASIGKASIDHIGADELVTLIGFAQAIKDGDTTVESVFKGKKDGGEAAYGNLFDAAETEKKKEENKNASK